MEGLPDFKAVNDDTSTTNSKKLRDDKKLSVEDPIVFRTNADDTSAIAIQMLRNDIGTSMESTSKSITTPDCSRKRAIERLSLFLWCTYLVIQ